MADACIRLWGANGRHDLWGLRAEVADNRRYTRRHCPAWWRIADPERHLSRKSLRRLGCELKIAVNHQHSALIAGRQQNDMNPAIRVSIQESSSRLSFRVS